MLDVVRLGRNISSGSHLKPYPVNTNRRIPRKPSVQLWQLTRSQQQHIPFQHTQQSQQQGRPDQPALAFPGGQAQNEHRGAQFERLTPEEGHGPSFQRAESSSQKTQGEQSVGYEISSRTDQSRKRRVPTRHQTRQHHCKHSHARLRHQCPYKTLIGAPTDSCSFLVGQHDGSVVFHTAHLWPCGPLANCRLTSHPSCKMVEGSSIQPTSFKVARGKPKEYIFF